jgi:hypothetical protein
MNKLKSLKKKIRRLEARQQKGAKKLAKLKQKLEAAAAKTKSKTAAPGGKPGKTSSVSARTHKKKQPAVLKAQVKPAAAVKAPSVPKQVKRKLNLTPERREQLATAMRARWAAKRAAAAPNTQGTSFDGGGSPGDAPQPQ